MIEISAEEAVELLGENLISTTVEAPVPQGETQDDTEVVFITTDATHAHSGETRVIQVHELNEQTANHFLPVMTSEEQAAANTLADLAR